MCLCGNQGGRLCPRIWAIKCASKYVGLLLERSHDLLQLTYRQMREISNKFG